MLRVLEKGLILDKEGKLYYPHINLLPGQVRDMLLFKHCLGPTYLHINNWLGQIVGLKR